MTLREIDSWLAKQEGKRHQATIGDCREIRKLLVQLMAKKPEARATIMAATGKLIAKKKGRK